MEENSKEKEKGEKVTPKHNLYNFTLSPYFVRKETGIQISSPDAKACVKGNTDQMIFKFWFLYKQNVIVNIILG